MVLASCWLVASPVRHHKRLDAAPLIRMADNMRTDTARPMLIVNVLTLMISWRSTPLREMTTGADAVVGADFQKSVPKALRQNSRQMLMLNTRSSKAQKRAGPQNSSNVQGAMTHLRVTALICVSAL